MEYRGIARGRRADGRGAAPRIPQLARFKTVPERLEIRNLCRNPCLPKLTPVVASLEKVETRAVGRLPAPEFFRSLKSIRRRELLVQPVCSTAPRGGTPGPGSGRRPRRRTLLRRAALKRNELHRPSPTQPLLQWPHETLLIAYTPSQSPQQVAPFKHTLRVAPALRGLRLEILGVVASVKGLRGAARSISYQAEARRENTAGGGRPGDRHWPSPITENV